jgi:N-acyl-D-amino-acid deacylase
VRALLGLTVPFAFLAACSSSPIPQNAAGTTHAGGAGQGGTGGATTTTASGGGAPSDAGPDASPADEAACEAKVVAGWKASPPAVGLGSPGSSASYDAVVGKLMADYGVPGGAVAVVKDGKLLLARGYGFADTDALAVAHPDALFRLASLSKQVTSAGVLVLVQKGALSLDAHPVPMLGLAPLPGQAQNPALASITVRDLLRHTGGWNRDVEGDPMFEPAAIASAAGVPSPPDCATIARYMLSRPTTYAPGTTYDYSNFGYCVLGLLLEKVTGSPYEAWIRANVLAPTGAGAMLEGRTFAADRAESEVTYYDYPGAPLATNVFPNGPAQVPWPYGGFDLEAMAAHGAWLASPIALLRLQVGLDGRGGAAPLLSGASLAAMTANPHVPWGNADGSTTPASDPYWYGLGWLVNSAGNWWHTGSLPGTATEQVHAASGFGWAAFFNTRPEKANEFFTRLDQDLWKALSGAGDWLAFDAFDQYAGAWTPWASAADYQATFDAQAKAGAWPVHVEGRLDAGGPAFRARFAPFHGAAFQAHHGLDCVGYAALAAQYANEGDAVASLSSFVDAGGRRRFQGSWAR